MFNNRIIIALFAMTIIPPVFAADAPIADPMRPPTATIGAAASGAPQWHVTGILVSQGRRLAMVNNRLLGVGDRVNGARIKAIYANAVELDIGGRAITVNAVRESIRKINKE